MGRILDQTPPDDRYVMRFARLTNGDLVRVHRRLTGSEVQIDVSQPVYEVVRLDGTTLEALQGELTLVDATS